MRSDRRMPTTQLVELPVQVARAISDAAKEFAERMKNSGQAIEVVEWYHGEPVWFIERVTTGATNAQKVVERVQIAGFEILGHQSLFILPDAYTYEQARHRALPSSIARLATQDSVLLNREIIDIYTERGEIRPYKEIYDEVLQALAGSWSFATSLTS